jgi:hypothetical protein
MAASSTTWIQGVSGNPLGRPKRSKQSLDRYVQTFLKRAMSPKELYRLYNHLLPPDQLRMLESLLPYGLARKTPENALESLSIEELEAIRDSLMISNPPVKINLIQNDREEA